MRTQKIKLYIPEYIPSGNKGEEAIVQGIAEGLVQKGKIPKISIFSYDADTDQENYGEDFKIVKGITFRPEPYGAFLPRLIEAVGVWIKHVLFFLSFRLLGEKCFWLFRSENWREYLNADIIMVGHDGVLSIEGGRGWPFELFLATLRIPM